MSHTPEAIMYMRKLAEAAEQGKTIAKNELDLLIKLLKI